jgi:hypothetical protein
MNWLAKHWAAMLAVYSAVLATAGWVWGVFLYRRAPKQAVRVEAALRASAAGIEAAGKLSNLVGQLYCRAKAHAEREDPVPRQRVLEFLGSATFLLDAIRRAEPKLPELAKWAEPSRKELNAIQRQRDADTVPAKDFAGAHAELAALYRTLEEVQR